MAAPSSSSLTSSVGLLFRVAVCCLCLLALPAFGMLRSRGGDVLVTENRRLAPFPPWRALKDLAAFPHGFEEFFADRFHFREVLTSLHHRILVGWFYRSPVKNVLLGRDGWLYLNGPQGDFVDVTYRNTLPFSESALAAIHAEMKRRRDWIASWGGKTVFVIVPEKETIYPEYLPRVYEERPNPQSRYDQWWTICQSDPDLTCVDLRPALRAMKKDGLIFYRADSHWNSAGAYAGYREFMKTVGNWFPVTPSTAKPVPVVLGAKLVRGDLAKMLAVGDWFDEREPVGYGDPYDSSLLRCAREVAPVSGGRPIPAKSEPLVFECDAPSRPSAVMIRDSMADRWRPWLSDNFRRAVWMFNWFPDAGVIERERPELVIFENIERTIEQFLVVRLDRGEGQARFSRPPE